MRRSTPTWPRARRWTRRAPTRSRISAARSWRAWWAPTRTSSGSRWRRRASSWRGSACSSALRSRLEGPPEGLEVKHLLGGRNPERGGERRVGAHDRERLPHLLCGHEAVAQVGYSGRLEQRLELLRRAGHAPPELRGELVGAPRADPLLGGQERPCQGGEVGAAEAPVGPHEEGGVDGRRAEGLGDRLGRPEVGQELRLARGEEPAGEGFGNERRVELARADRRGHPASPQAQDVDVGDADAAAGQEPAEPGVLGGARSDDADAEAGEVLDRAHRVDVLGGDEQDHGRRRGEPEDEPWRLTRLARPEAQ